MANSGQRVITQGSRVFRFRISRIFSFIYALSAVLFVGAFSQAVSAQSAAPSQQSVQIVTVQASTSASSVTLGGTVIAYRQVTLTAQIPGRVELRAGREGDHFKKDDILVAIDDDDLLAKRRAAVAQYNNAQASIGNAQMQYQRELYSPSDRSISRSGGMGIPNMFDQMFTQPMSEFAPGNVGGDRHVDRGATLYSRGTQVTQAHNQQLTALSQIQEIDAKLRDARSFAPFDGVITKKFVEVGDTVQPGQPLIEFADLTYLQVEVDVPVRLMSGLSAGMLVPVKLDVGDRLYVEGRVAQIFPSADSVRHTVKVKFDLPIDTPGGPGMYAEVRVPDTASRGDTVPVIPDSAVLWRGSLPAVYVVTDDDRSELRLIRLGDYLGQGQVAVLSGLSVGERIYAVPPASSASGWSMETPKDN